MRNDDDPRLTPTGRYRAIARALALLGLASALAACAVGPKYVSPKLARSDQWQEQANPRIEARTAVDSAWWRVFGDTTLDRLIGLAHQQDLPLQVAGLRILESRAQLGLAVGRQYPQLQTAFASVNAVRLSERAVSFAGVDPDFQDFVDYQVGFDAVWELDFWRAYRRGVKAEAASYLASVADYDDALVTLTAEVARTYTMIRTFEVLIDQARENVAIQEEGLRIADARFRHGVTSELDVAQATTLLESTRASVPQLQLGLQQAQNALSTLLGQPPGSLQPLLAGRRGIPSVPASVAVGVPTEMLRRRPDIRSAELTAVAQSDRVGIAVSNLYPSLSLAGTLGFQTSTGAGPGSGGPLFDAASVFYALGARLMYPVLDYGRIKNKVRAEDAVLQRSLVDYRQTVLRALQEAEDGMAGFLRSQEAVVFVQNAANAARRSVDLSLVQYREGAVDYQRVLDAQRSLLQEQTNLAQSRSSIATNLIALYKALGGGWELRRGQPFVPEAMLTEMRGRIDWGDLLEKPPAEKTVNQVVAPPR